jgi:hypothetical protein
MSDSICCFIPCEHAAEFQLVLGLHPRVDDFTEACADHVGHLIPDGTQVTVFALQS